ncbi:MAG: serine protease, partial [Cyanobacteriota bacterium]|nr:serine protease [Cyanobacteriota bacterium]
MPTARPGPLWRRRLPAQAIYRRLAPAVLTLTVADGEGAGVLLTRTGLVVSCHHLVEGWSTASAALAGGKRGCATVLRAYRDADLAFLQLEPPLLAAARRQLRAPLIGGRLPRGRWPEVGETVLVIGHPMGLQHSLSRGVVSGCDRLVDGRRYLQLDASINPGNSGGPVCSERAEWLGIVTCSRIDCEGVSFAIPMPTVYAKLGELRQELRQHPEATLCCTACGHRSPPGRYCRHCGSLLALVQLE